MKRYPRIDQNATTPAGVAELDSIRNLRSAKRLRLPEKEELLKRVSIASLADLETKLSLAVESLEKGRKVDGEEVFSRLRSRVQSRNG